MDVGVFVGVFYLGDFYGVVYVLFGGFVDFGIDVIFYFGYGGGGDDVVVFLGFKDW